MYHDDHMMPPDDHPMHPDDHMMHHDGYGYFDDGPRPVFRMVEAGLLNNGCMLDIG